MCYSLPPYLSKVKNHRRACQKSNTLATALPYFPRLLCVLTHFHYVQQQNKSDPSEISFEVTGSGLRFLFTGGGNTDSEVGNMIYPCLSQHIKEQWGLAVKLARSESGYLASSCDFVTNLQSNCWVYFSLILAVCKMGFIFLVVGLFKEHTL